jgi:hypothetical protein
VYTPVTRPHDQAPADILRTAGFDLLADMVIGHILETEKAAGRLLWHRPANAFLPHRGGVSEVGYPDELPPHRASSYINVSRSHSKRGPSSSRQESKDEILSVADLTARIVR